MTFALIQQAAPSGPPQFMNLIIFAAIPVMFYFLMIRPQNKMRKQQEERLSKLKAGDEVILQGGLFGTIDRVEDKVIFVKLGNAVVKARRSAVVQLATEPEQQA